MGRHNVPAGTIQIARVGAAFALALALANCGKSSVDSKYGVSASPRVVDPGAPVPKGGGTYRVGKPYQVAGRTYVPEENTSYEAEGVASWYGDVFHGRLTANGEVFDMNSVSAAHPTLPLPSYVRVTNLRNNRSLIVRVNDRGPFHENRVIDVSVRAAKLLDFHRFGVTRVRVEYVGRASLNGSDDEKLATTLRRGAPAPGPATMVASAKPKPYRPEYFDPRPIVRTASAAAPQPAAQPAPAPPTSFESRFAPAASAPRPARTEPVSAFAPRFDSVLTGRGLY